jgi:hypothetical protein
LHAQPLEHAKRAEINAQQDKKYLAAVQKEDSADDCAPGDETK